jgi:hypothetical protein
MYVYVCMYVDRLRFFPWLIFDPESRRYVILLFTCALHGPTPQEKATSAPAIMLCVSVFSAYSDTGDVSKPLVRHSEALLMARRPDAGLELRACLALWISPLVQTGGLYSGTAS